MTDVVVTVPKSFGLENWIAEGDLPGDEWSGLESYFFIGHRRPKIEKGERVYIVYNYALRGYAPLVRVEKITGRGFALVRRGGAVAVTIRESIRGFQGYRYRWWDYEDEFPFPNWKVAEAKPWE